MNTTTTTETTTNGAAPPPADAGEAATLQQRVNALHDQFRAEGSNGAISEPVDGAPVAAPPSAEPPPADSATAPSPAAVERKARLDALRAREAARMDKKARHAEQDKLSADLAAATKRADEAEARASARIDRETLKDPVRVMAILQEEGVAPHRIAEAIREAMANPEKYAEARAREEAKKLLDPEVKTLREELAALKARDEEREKAWQAHQQQQAEARAAGEFFQFTEQNATHAPYAAAFLKVHGGEAFYELANKAAASVPEGAGWQAVLDVIEENFTGLAPVFTNSSNSTSNGKPPTPRPAAAKANTLTNTLAQERTSVAQAEDWSSLSFEERVARLKSAR